MNIMFVASDNNRHSGAFMSMVALTSLLQEKYHYKILVVLPREGDGKELLDKAHIETVTISSYDWSMRFSEQKNPVKQVKFVVKTAITKHHVNKLAKLMLSREIDVVHINTSRTYVGALAAQKAQIPFIWHIREFLEEDQFRCIQNREKGYALMRRADKVVAISESIYRKYAPVLGKEKLTVILNGIDAGRYLNETHEILSGDTAELLMVGGLNEGKGQRQALKACAALRDKGKRNFHLRLVGSGSEEYTQQIKQMASELNLDGFVEFCGPQDDTPSYYGSSDIFLMCSKAEAFGRVTVEAMMGGCLVIGNNTAGTKDLIEDGVTGLLYEDRNIDDLVQKIEYALEHKEEVRKIAAEGRRFMAENMTAEMNAEKINDLYHEVIGGGKAQDEIIILAVYAMAFRERRACA